MAKNGIPGSAVWGGLIRATHYVERHLQRSLIPVKLGLSEFAVMEVLHREGPLPITMVGEKISLCSSSMTPRVDQLEKRRLVRRSTMVSDRRVRLIELTSEGTALVVQAIVIYEVAIESVFASLTQLARKEFSLNLENIENVASSSNPVHPISKMSRNVSETSSPANFVSKTGLISRNRNQLPLTSQRESPSF